MRREMEVADEYRGAFALTNKSRF